MPSLPEVVAELRASLEEISRLAGAVITPTVGGPLHDGGLRLAETASDVLAAGQAIQAAHRAAIPVFRATRNLPAQFVIAADTAALTQPPELDRLRILMKSWLFFVRALCDNAYGILLAQAEGGPARFGSMKRAATNPSNPVARLLAAEAPDVIPWFERHRLLRNKMKDGVNFGFTDLDARGLELSVYKVTVEETPAGPALALKQSETFALAGVAEDARMVVRLLQVVAR